MNTTAVVLIIVIAALVVAALGFIYSRKERTRRLKTKFGPEYDRLVKKGRDPRKAEEELVNRQRRVEKLHIRELGPAEVDRFSESWRSVQTEFVDTPREAVAKADRLVREVMTTRGYPMGNFEQRAADISVAHPKLVEQYRLAHDIAVRDEAGQATTEELRQAMVNYRSLFEDLLSTTSATRRVEEVKR
jgi:FtsZ-interacting cell division protein ZipA